jgi:hypothetical protein
MTNRNEAGSNQDVELHEKILEGLERMDGKFEDDPDRVGTSELPRILKTILDSVRAGQLQPMMQTTDGRQVKPIVGLGGMLRVMMRYPSLVQEFTSIYFKGIDGIAYFGDPRVSEESHQSMTQQKAGNMQRFLSDVGLGEEWSGLSEGERVIALATLFDQFLFQLTQKMQSEDFAQGFVDKFGVGQKLKDMVARLPGGTY